MALDQAYGQKLQNLTHQGTAVTVTTPIHLRQMTTVGSSSANGTELATSGGYTSGTGAPSCTFGTGTAATPVVSSNSAAVTITNMPATTVNGVEEWTSDGTPFRTELGSLTSAKTTASGDTLTYAIAAVASSLQ